MARIIDDTGEYDREQGYTILRLSTAITQCSAIRHGSGPWTIFPVDRDQYDMPSNTDRRDIEAILRAETADALRRAVAELESNADAS
jgi:hypothetical protein